MARARSRGRSVITAFTVALLVGLPALGFLGTAASPAPAVQTQTAPNVPVIVAPAYLPAPGVRSLGPLDPTTPLDVAVSLASPDPVGLQDRLALEYAAGSPENGQFLTASQVAARYAPSAATYEAATRYFQSAGASVTASPDRWMLLVQGPASTIASAFHTQFDDYSAGGRTFYSHPTDSILPPIAPWAGVLGLGNETPAAPYVGSTGPATPAAGCSGTQPFAPCAIASAYNVSGFYSAGDNGTGVRIGVVDPYDGQENQSTLASDLGKFTTRFGLPAGNVHYLYPVPTKRNLNTSSTGWGIEEALDLQWTRASAPGAALDMTFSPDASASLYFSVDWLVANQLVNVISLSWGEPDVGAFNTYLTPCSSACNATSDGSYQILHPVMEAAALEGIGVFAASGDCGAAMGTNGVSTSYPASDPDVTGIGATDLALSGVRWAGEVAWSGNSTGASSPGCQNQGGSGGGYSPFPRPYWQAGPGVPGARTVRGVPDISIDGGSPVTIYQSGFSTGVIGTSVATPIWAGLAAVADQLHGGPLGLLNPSLYELARSSSARSYFHDVVSGYNGYSAGSGWDPVTGIGTPNASALLPALAAGTGLGPVEAPSLSAANRVGPAPLDVRFTAAVPNGAPVVVGFDVDLGDGNSTWTVNGSIAHTYTRGGAYTAEAVVLYADGNSSASPPVLVLAGTGAPLRVQLSVNATTPSVGAPVGFHLTVSGGTAPYLYDYHFGDGSYYANATVVNWTHVYGFAGGFCAAATVTDAATPADGGASLEVPVAVGGAPAPSCPDETALSVTLPPEPAAMDLPANVNLTATAVGGAGPVGYRVVSDDPYVTECQCGIFRIPGNHTIRLFANDSVSQEATTWLNITAYPALAGAFFARSGTPSGPPIGPAPLTVAFGANVSGGQNASASATVWTFGDGATPLTGATAAHTYTTPGYYLARAVVKDAYNGTSVGAFLVDVLPGTQGSSVGVSVSVNLGPGAAAGNLVAFGASTNVSSTGVQFAWQLGDNDASYGYAPTQSYTTGCLAADRCPLAITVNATDSLGTIANVTFVLPFPFFGRSSALNLSDRLTGAGGGTPYALNATATTSSMPGARVGWEFGDGNGSSGTNVSHTYFSPGNYTVIETAQDTIGDVEVRSHTVSVIGPPITPLVYTGGPSARRGVAPFPVAFHANASGGYGGPYTYAWGFGDGENAQGPWANHTYAGRGNFTANLTVTDHRGTRNFTSWEIQAFNRTMVVLVATLSPSVVAPGGTFWLNVSAEALCTPGSVAGCSDANVTGGTATPGFGSGGCAASPAQCAILGSAELTAPGTAGPYPIWVNATGFYQGSAQAVLDVATPTGPSLTAEQIILIGGAIGGGIAVVAVVVGIVRRRSPPVSP